MKIIKKYFHEVNESDLEIWTKRSEIKESKFDKWLISTQGPKKNRLPREWFNSSFNQPSQPVVGVCYYEALAYCRWLSSQLAGKYRLPTEAEWQAAAGGLENRRWPWGNSPAQGFPEAFTVNSYKSHLRSTSPTGVFPSGDTPLGIYDMAGNVWEWCSSSYSDQVDKNVCNVIAPLEDDRNRVLKGGAWGIHEHNLRTGFRHSVSRSFSFDAIGFRVVREL